MIRQLNIRKLYQYSTIDVFLTGGVALFNEVTGFTQTAVNLTIAVDKYNHCIRSINPLTGETAPYAGLCGKPGFADGRLVGEAQFSYPHTIVFHQGVLYVTDSKNHALRLLSAGRVSTIIRDSDAFPRPYGLIFSSDDLAYVTSQEKGLLQLDLSSRLLTKLTNGRGIAGSLSAAQLLHPNGLTFLSPSVLLVTDPSTQRLLIVNINNGTITKICDGKAATRDGDIQSCQLLHPHSVLVVNQSVYVGQYKAIRRVPVAALNKFIPPVETTTAIPGRSSSPSPKPP